MHDRNETLRDLTGRPLDVLVIGGGIVGAGVARDAALRGLRCGLVERHDFAFGTSSRSSRLLHGGLRYLAQGRLRLVREASVEKCLLGVLAPHLTAPLPFVFPTYRGTPWRRWQLAVGVKVYDVLCSGRNFGRSQVFSRAAMEQHLPGLSRERLTGGVRYFDALTNDARLVIDTLRSATLASALVVNYVRFRDAQRAGTTWRCDMSDEIAAQPLSVEARVIVNATGPWSQQIPHSGVRLRLTKGVHLVIDCDRLPVPDAVVMADGKRILFAIPWGERVILGTTDTDYEGTPEDVRTDAADVANILDVTNRTFPDARLTPGDVLSTWAGLRPLIAKGRGGPSDISRAHQITSPEPGWIDVAGGKLTTYRLIAEQTVDRAVELLGLDRRPSRTAQLPLLPEADRTFSGILPPPVTREAVAHFCRTEGAVHLDDVMRRRSSWHYYRLDRNAVAAEVARWMTELNGWDETRSARETTAYQDQSD